MVYYLEEINTVSLMLFLWLFSSLNQSEHPLIAGVGLLIMQCWHNAAVKTFPNKSNIKIESDAETHKLGLSRARTLAKLWITSRRQMSHMDKRVCTCRRNASPNNEDAVQTKRSMCRRRRIRRTFAWH